VQTLKDVVEKRLRQMIAKNPQRIDFYQRYQQIIDEYNQEKDRITIEQTFEALLKFVESLDEEDTRNMREGLDEETLTLFDLLIKPELTTKDRNRLKRVAQDLLARLKAEKLRIDQWREKETTQSEIKMFIYDFLWDDKTGLPSDLYTEDDVKQKAETIFNYVFQQYPSAVSPAYAP
jgi:type I restriction enzyme, R subunit